MNNNRKQSTDPLFPTTSSIFNSSSTLLMPSSSPSLPPTTPQRRRFEVLLSTPPPLKSEPTDFLHTTTSTTPFHHPSTLKRPRATKNVVVPTATSTLARQRRARLSDKTRCLQKLIPLECQMDTATLYDQTHKYVKFLKAQFTVLQSMPLQIPTTTTHRRPPQNNNIDDNHYRMLSGVEELGRLNRQQLLQVLMSSEVAQTVMYTNGLCVFSAEQLAALLNDREKQGAVAEQRFI